MHGSLESQINVQNDTQAVATNLKSDHRVACIAILQIIS